MPRGSGEGSDFEISVEGKKKGKSWTKLKEVNVETRPAEGDLHERAHLWMESEPGKKYRIKVVDHHPEHRGAEIKKDVVMDVTIGGDDIDTCVFYNSGIKAPPMIIDSIIVQEDEEDVSYPLTFLARDAESKPEVEGGVAPMPGEGKIQLVFTYGTETCLEEPAPAPAVDIAGTALSKHTKKDGTGSIKPQRPSEAPAVLHQSKFEDYGNEPFYEVIIRYCAPGTLERCLARLAAAEVPTAETPSTEAASARAPPTPQSLAPSSTSGGNSNGKRPSDASPTRPKKTSRPWAPIGRASAAIEARKQLEAIEQEARYAVDTARRLLDDMRRGNADYSFGA